MPAASEGATDGTAAGLPMSGRSPGSRSVVAIAATPSTMIAATPRTPATRAAGPGRRLMIRPTYQPRVDVVTTGGRGTPSGITGSSARATTGGLAVAPLHLLTGTARARVVAPGRGHRRRQLLVVPGHQRHDLARLAPGLEQPHDHLRRLVDVPEEGHVPGAQVVEPGLPVRRGQEPVLGALAVAREPDVALAAHPRQRVPLGRPERLLLRRPHQVHHRQLPDVPQAVLRLHEVVARVQVAVVLQRETGPARLVEHAQPGPRRPEVVPDRRLERLHVHAPDVVVDPLVPDRRQEPPELLRPHGPHRRRHPPHRVRVPVLVHALDDRDELHPVRAHLVAQEPVDLERVVAVEPVDGREHVVLDLVRLEQPQPAHDVVEGGLAALVDAVAVVERARPVDGDPDEVLVLGQERRPLVVDARPVGLDRVLERHPRPPVPLLELARRAGRSPGPSAWVRRPARRR